MDQIRGRRRYDPAATRSLSAIAPSLLTARLPERREGSHLRAAVQFVAVAGIRISFQLLAEIPGIFFRCLYLLLLPESNLPACRAVSGGLRFFFLHECFQKCVWAAGKTTFHHCEDYFGMLAHILPSDLFLRGDERRTDGVAYLQGRLLFEKV